MILFLAALVAAGALLSLHLARSRRWPAWSRTAAVVTLALLPLLYGALVLGASRERIGQLRFEPVGKHLAYGPETPLTAGGSAPEAGEGEDLYSGLLASLPPRVVRLEPTDEEGSDGAGNVLVLATPSPVVVVTEPGEDPRILNAHDLDDGDRIVLAGGGVERLRDLELREGLWSDELVYRPSEEEPERAMELDGRRVVYLPDVLDLLGIPRAEDERYQSALVRQGRGWRLLLRDATVEIATSDGEVHRFVARHPVGDELELALRVVWTANNQRTLRTVRRDRILVGEGGEVEVRYTEPPRIAVEPPRAPGGPGPGRLAIAVLVPDAFEERAMIELPEASSRFRGLSALFELEADGAATLTHLGQTETVELGTVYGLGEGLGGDGGSDRLLVRIGREPFPWFLLADLLLLGLFVLVFLGRPLRADGALAGVAGPVGLLLANRLLFAYRAAERPPDFETGVLVEARVALWLIPALLLGLYTVGWLLARRTASGPLAPGQIAWPLGALGVATVGILRAGGSWDAVVPVVLVAVAVGGLVVLSGRPRLAAAARRLRRDGVPWTWWAPVAAGVGVFLVRALADVVGMPETLRLPGGGRVLWTVFQIPCAVVVVALSLHLVERLGRRRGERAAAGRVVLAVAAILAFLALAFAAVALMVDDTGLVIAQSLPYVLALLALAGLGGVLRAAGAGEGGARERGLRLAALVLLVLPATGVLWMNLFPQQAVAVGSRLLGGGSPAEGPAALDQRMFRLYMLSEPQVLREFGLVASERMAVHYSTLQDYAETGGWAGAGFLATELPRYLGATYLSDLVPMVFVLPELGKLGLVGLGILYLLPLVALALFAAPPERGSPVPDGTSPLARQALWTAAVALLAVAVPSLFMILGNLNMVLFTGKNAALLGVNSLSDVLETGLLLGLAAAALALRGVSALREPDSSGRPRDVGSGSPEGRAGELAEETA